jgi:porin
VLAGAWSYTGRFDYWPDDADERAVGRGNRGAYLRSEWRLSDTVAVFGRYGMAAGRFNPTADFFGAGVTWQGPLPGRPRDTLGFALAWAEASSRYGTGPGPAGAESDEREVALELTYRAPVGERLVLQPDLQLVLDPGFDPGLDDVLVLGLRLEVNLN